MTEKKFDNLFHKRYVGGEGEVAEKEKPTLVVGTIRGMSYEGLLAEYRWYVRDPEAELPKEVEKQLQLLGVI